MFWHGQLYHGIVVGEVISAWVEEKWNKRALKQLPLQSACLCAGGVDFLGLMSYLRRGSFVKTLFCNSDYWGVPLDQQEMRHFRLGNLSMGYSLTMLFHHTHSRNFCDWPSFELGEGNSFPIGHKIHRVFLLKTIKLGEGLFICCENHHPFRQYNSWRKEGEGRDKTAYQSKVKC